MMHEPEKSDSAIVATKPANKAGQLVAEPVERRAGTGRNANQQSTCRAQNRESVSQALGHVRQAATIHGVSPNTPGRSRVREFRSHGSVRGAVSNGRPYREQAEFEPMLSIGCGPEVARADYPSHREAFLVRLRGPRQLDLPPPANALA